MDIFEAYPGGKNVNGTYQRIINEIPPHMIYYEPFVGGGTILRKKRPAAYSVINDIDENVMKQWRNYKMEGLNLNNKNALEFIPKVAPDIDGESFMYLDPPYPEASRRSDSKLYDYVLSDKDHERLLDIMTTVNFNCMISTYPNEIYEKKLQTWRKIEFQSTTRGSTATEVLYMNYEEPNELHDYQYLGNDSWDRQRIKRKISRIVNTLSNLPPLERKAILLELNGKLGLK